MENKLLSFNEFETLYESFGFIAEAEAPAFTPEKSTVTSDELLDIFGSMEVDEALDTKAFAPIKKGEKSDRVKQLQKDLGIEADGTFGDGTEKKVKEFQTTNKLTVDGKVGVQTLRKMLELKGDKTPDKTIETKYVVKTEAQAKSAGINPELLDLYDITIVNNGETQYVILVPKKDAAAKAKELQAKGAFKGFEWLAEGVKYAGKALIYTATGLTLATLEIAKAMISGIASAATFIAGGAAFVMGAYIQGLATIAKWIGKAGKAAYAKISTAANEVYTTFCKGFAKVAKASVQAFTAFMTGVKAVAYTATGIALAAFKAVASVLDPAVKTLVQGAKDGAAFIANGMAWVASNVKNGAIAIKNAVEAGWKNVAASTQKAWNGAKTAAKSAGDAMYKAAGDAYTATASFLSDMYASGKNFWESLSELTGNPIFESEEFTFEDIDFTIA
jgi:peptidoglycan hydrolase-like protein with peptidoglycan-binding domain